MSKEAPAVIATAEARAIMKFLELADKSFSSDAKSYLGELISERLTYRLKLDPAHKELYQWVRRESSTYIQIFSEEIGRDIKLLDLPEEDRLFLRALLGIAPLVHKFYLAWSGVMGSDEFAQDAVAKNWLLKTVPHFANPYTLILKENGGYRVLSFRDHPAVSYEVEMLLGGLREAAASLPPGSIPRKFMEAWHCAMAERDLNKIPWRWYALYSSWLQLDGKITLGLPLEERYEDLFAIRHHPELMIEIADEEYRQLERDIRRHTALLQKEFVRMSRPYGATALRRARALSGARIIVRAAVMGAGRKFFSGSLQASTQPNDFRFRVNHGFRIVHFPRTELAYLQKHEAPTFHNFLTLLGVASLPAEETPDAILRPSVLRITAHEASHLLFRRGIPAVEEVKAEILGWYGLNRLFKTGRLARGDWSAVCRALFANMADCLESIARNAEAKDLTPSQLEVKSPYARAEVIFANHCLYFGVVNPRQGGLDFEKLDILLEALAKKFIRIYTAKNFTAACGRFLQDEKVSFLDPQWNDVALKLRELKAKK